MTEPFFTILALLVFGASVILAVWGVFSVVPSVGHLLARSFWCPFRNRNVTAEFRDDLWNGAHVDVPLNSRVAWRRHASGPPG
jgi:hypothetical protein